MGLVAQHINAKNSRPKPKAIPAEIQIDRYDLTKVNLYYKLLFSSNCPFNVSSAGKQNNPIAVFSAVVG
jgi:hypothetical protein